MAVVYFQRRKDSRISMRRLLLPVICFVKFGVRYVTLSIPNHREELKLFLLTWVARHTLCHGRYLFEVVQLRGAQRLGNKAQPFFGVLACF